MLFVNLISANDPRKGLEMHMKDSQAVTRTIKDTANIAYGVIEQHAREWMMKSEQVYYEVVGAKSKRENAV